VQAPFGVRDVSIHGFRSARAVGFAPGPVCALVGGPSVGKSNVLAAVWTLLQHGSPSPRPEDMSSEAPGAIHLAARLADGDEVALEVSPSRPASRSGRQLPVLFLPTPERSDRIVAGPIEAEHAQRLARDYFASTDLVAAVERLVEARESGLVLLVEEPELFLRPQAQRYLYRLLRSFADAGNQVLYSTHSPAFLNVGRLDELALVAYGAETGTTIVQPEPLPADESFRALSELDAERSELFLARAVLLVEGRTEKLTFPFLFRALGHDADREAITIVDCGGKSNLLLFLAICQAVRVPSLVVHDRDAAPGKQPIVAERVLNAQIAELAGPGGTVVFAPDFEAVAGLRAHSHKPTHAWERFSTATAAQVPSSLAEAVEKIVALARGG
jgi:hypothetical protein